MKLKLLIVHKALAPYRIDIFNELNKRFDCRFCFEYETALEQSFAEEFIRRRVTFDYEVLPPANLGFKNLRLSLFGIVRNFRPDIILSSEFNLTTPTLLLAKKLFCKSAKLVTFCDDNEVIAMNQLRHSNAKAFLMTRVDGVVCCDKRAHFYYAKLYEAQQHFHCMPIVQDECLLRRHLESVLPQAAQWRASITGGDPEVRILLYVGRLAPEKNLYNLVGILSQMIQLYPKLKTIFVGDGPEETNLRKRIAHHKLDEDVLLIGKREGDDLMACYGGADLFVLPSYLERFGAVANEAMISGLRICCSAAAGISPWVDNSCGTTFNPDDCSNFYMALYREIYESYKANPSPVAVELKPSLMSVSFMDEVESLYNYLIELRHCES